MSELTYLKKKRIDEKGRVWKTLKERLFKKYIYENII